MKGQREEIGTRIHRANDFAAVLVELRQSRSNDVVVRHGVPLECQDQKSPRQLARRGKRRSEPLQEPAVSKWPHADKPRSNTSCPQRRGNPSGGFTTVG